MLIYGGIGRKVNLPMGNLYTIGHSTVNMDFFLNLLKKYKVDYLFDVRSIPYSKYARQFNRETLANVLKRNGIEYVYMGTYFGARQVDCTLYDNEGVLDFEKVRDTDQFKLRLKSTKRGLAKGHNIVLMCAEKDPFDCHRAIMLARGFEIDGTDVKHILHDGSILSQKDFNKRLLEYFFPNRKQSVLNFYGENEKSEQEYLLEAYRLRNKQIGYRYEMNSKVVI